VELLWVFQVAFSPSSLIGKENHGPCIFGISFVLWVCSWLGFWVPLGFFGFVGVFFLGGLFRGSGVFWGVSTVFGWVSNGFLLYFGCLMGVLLDFGFLVGFGSYRWYLGSCGFSWVIFRGLVRLSLCIHYVYLRAPYAFLIKFSYKKKIIIIIIYKFVQHVNFL